MAKDYKQLDGIKQCMNDNLIGAYNKGYKQGQEDANKCWSTGYNEGYAQGLNDAWECARKILGTSLPIVKRSGLFSDLLDDCGDNFDKHIIFSISAAEAISRIHARNEKTKAINEVIEIGDEIIAKRIDSNELLKGIVIDIDNNSGAALYFVDKTGRRIFTTVSQCNKTGKSYPEFIEILNKLRDNVEDE